MHHFFDFVLAAHFTLVVPLFADVAEGKEQNQHNANVQTDCVRSQTALVILIYSSH